MAEFRIEIVTRDGDAFHLHFDEDTDLDLLTETTDTLRGSKDVETAELHVSNG